MSDLPKCKLCGGGVRNFPALNGETWAIHDGLERDYCSLEHVRMLPDEWRALMGPPAVTDAMVERGAVAVSGNSWRWPEDLARAVLEAALKE